MMEKVSESEEVDLSNITGITLYPAEGLVTLSDKKGKVSSLRAAIREAVIEGAKVEVRKIYKGPHATISFTFEKPVACEITNSELRCPKEAKFEWEIE